jgi:acyl-[acyl-carrier-protein]-phospholipid O-acyltransferase/long-chain-fatty-acid--[acyl-carrier-protein] ligase
MVPHVKIEEMVSALTGGAPCAVTGIPDERKGERLAVLYTAAGFTPEQIWRGLSAMDMPNLWVPKPENIHHVESLPVLGSGKLDLRAVKALAQTLNV